MTQEELFDAYLRQELNDEQLADLVQKLEADTEFKDAFFNYVDETSAMVQCANDMKSEHLIPKTDELKQTQTEDKIPENNSKEIIPFNIKLISALAALFVCAFVVFNKTDLKELANILFAA